MRSFLLLPALLSPFFPLLTAVAGAASGEVPAQPITASTVEGCPVSLDLRLSIAPQRTLLTNGSPAPGAAGQELELTVQNVDLRSVKAIDGTLQMQSGRLRIERLEPGGSSAAARGERIPIHLLHVIHGGQDALLVQTIANSNPVESLELDRILFADGSQWTRAQATSGATCRFTPNLLVPVASR